MCTSADLRSRSQSRHTHRLLRRPHRPFHLHLLPHHHRLLPPNQILHRRPRPTRRRRPHRHHHHHQQARHLQALRRPARLMRWIPAAGACVSCGLCSAIRTSRASTPSLRAKANRADRWPTGRISSRRAQTSRSGSVARETASAARTIRSTTAARRMIKTAIRTLRRVVRMYMSALGS